MAHIGGGVETSGRLEGEGDTAAGDVRRAAIQLGQAVDERVGLGEVEAGAVDEHQT